MTSESHPTCTPKEHPSQPSQPLLKTPWSAFPISPGTMEKIRVQRFGEGQIEKVNLRVEKPPDSGAFGAKNLGTFEVSTVSGLLEYGNFSLDKETWELFHMGSEWEYWVRFVDGVLDATYLIYWHSPFTGTIWALRATLASVFHAKQDVAKLTETMFTNIEALHILDETLTIKGIRKKMIHKYMETLTDSMLKNLEMSGIKILESLTSSPILVHRAAPIHEKIVKIITAHAYQKNPHEKKRVEKKKCPACRKRKPFVEITVNKKEEIWPNPASIILSTTEGLKDMGPWPDYTGLKEQAQKWQKNNPMGEDSCAS